ncbi:MAG: NUDIX hydrolase [Hyphomicrobiaceae bacterium]
MPIVRQVGVLPIRTRKGRAEALLITSSRDRWIIPKGRISKRLKRWETAAREAFEEAGVTGLISRQPLGEFTMTKAVAVELRVEVYFLEVERQFEDWPERQMRRRKWVSQSAACNLVAEQSLAEFIQSLKIERVLSETRAAEHV